MIMLIDNKASNSLIYYEGSSNILGAHVLCSIMEQVAVMDDILKVLLTVILYKL